MRSASFALTYYIWVLFFLLLLFSQASAVRVLL
jgi:hypothetical protein